MRVVVDFEMSHEALIAEWRRLYPLAEPNFFLSPPWVETWLGGIPDSVRIGVVRAFDDLRGVLGMGVVGVAPRNNFASFSEARLHETGIEDYDRIYLEYNDFLIAKSSPPETRSAMLDALLDALPRVEEFVFRNARTPIIACAEAIANVRNLELQLHLTQPTHQIELKSQGKSVFDGFSPSLRAKICRALRRYEERGPVALHRSTTGPDRAIAWTELMRLHAQTWSRRGASGVFRGERFMGFHGRIFERHPKSIDLVRVTVGNDTIGALYNFVSGARVYNYQSGFRYESDNQLVPGFVTHAIAAERYREDGYSTYDMMGGDADYKRRLGVEGETLKSFALTRRGLRSTLRSLSKSLRPFRAAETRQT